jgi:hypothetical protein
VAERRFRLAMCDGRCMLGQDDSRWVKVGMSECSSGIANQRASFVTQIDSMFSRFKERDRQRDRFVVGDRPPLVI